MTKKTIADSKGTLHNIPIFIAVVGGTDNRKSAVRGKGKREEELDLCPICDDICTCGQVGKSDASACRRTASSFKAMNAAATNGPTPKHQKQDRQLAKLGSTFIWDFNVRGQLIPLENLYSSGSDSGDEKFSSTDAECSDLVSGSDSGDHLSDVLSADDNLMEDGMMVYYQHLPVDTPAIKPSSNGNNGSNNNSNNQQLQFKISAITPQVLAAISKTLCNTGGSNSTNNTVLMVSDDADNESLFEDDEGDIEMIVVASSDDSNVGDGDNPEDDSEVSEPDSLQSWQRFKRVPVNAFYRRSRAIRNHHTNNLLHTANALRPSSVDPQFIVAACPHSDSSSEHIRIADSHYDDNNNDATTSSQNNNPATSYNCNTLLDIPLIYYQE